MDDVTPTPALIGCFTGAGHLPANQDGLIGRLAARRRQRLADAAPKRRNAVLNALEAMELLAASLPFIDSDVTDEDAPDWPSPLAMDSLIRSPLRCHLPAPLHTSTPSTGTSIRFISL